MMKPVVSTETRKIVRFQLQADAGVGGRTENGKMIVVGSDKEAILTMTLNTSVPQSFDNLRSFRDALNEVLGGIE